MTAFGKKMVHLILSTIIPKAPLPTKTKQVHLFPECHSQNGLIIVRDVAGEHLE